MVETLDFGDFFLSSSGYAKGKTLAPFVSPLDFSICFKVAPFVYFCFISLHFVLVL